MIGIYGNVAEIWWQLDIDHFMERSYLDALAKALGIPDDVKQGLEKDVRSVPA